MPPPFDDKEEQRKYSRALVALYVSRMEQATDDMLAERISLTQWHITMKDLLREGNVAQFITAKNADRDEIFVGDYGVLGQELKKQYRFLKNFARQIKNADADDELNWVAARARMYGRSIQASYWRSSVPVDLEQVPGDGKTLCKTNCQCTLRIEEETDADGNVVAILIFWETTAAESCKDCLELKRLWSPLRIPV